mmetsp:Transcript_69015/g.173885  ORF Transcript_69015/g.173885 Transcript_69015/m.173885 type:complete len:747 (+) Transcript_69015:67-2307(+)
MQLALRGASAATAVAALAMLASLAAPADAAKFSRKFFQDLNVGQAPVFKAADLVAKLEADVIADGKVEQQEWDKYMCWCEDSIDRKTKDIAKANKMIAKLGEQIPKLGAEVASHTAEIAQLKKDIGANQEAQREAEEIRSNENSAYESGKAESENSIGALEAAITVLTGAGTKKGFLETSKQAQLITVAAGVKTVLDEAAARTSDQDMETLRRFVQQPTEFLTGDASHEASFLQVGGRSRNPFGDYAPQSTQIQGILKGLYDGFVADMEKDHGAEADKQKAFEELMATKASELKDLQATLEQHESDKAAKAKSLADGKLERDDTEAQVKADTTFLEETKAGCKRKAQEWSIRSRLRTQELLGLGQALKILKDPDNVAIFTKSASTFLQLSSTSASSASLAVQRQRKGRALAGVRSAYQYLSSLARKLHSFSLARVAVQTKLGGHFDQVMSTIDQRIADIRKEEGEDIEHRDRCESSAFKNKNDIQDLEHAGQQVDEHMESIGDQIKDLNQKVRDLGGEISATDGELAELLKLRNEGHEAFKQALKDDTMAVGIIKSAMSVMAKFYKDNPAAMLLLQGASDPKYTIDKDKAPETSFDSKSYAGRQSQSKGALGALEMVVADIENEIEVSRKDEKEAEEQYEEDRAALTEVRDANKKSEVEAKKRIADLKERKEDKAAEETQIGQDLVAQKQLRDTIKADCAWVKTHFESRKVARKAEIDGLQEARGVLANIDQGDFDELSLSAADDS